MSILQRNLTSSLEGVSSEMSSKYKKYIMWYMLLMWLIRVVKVCKPDTELIFDQKPWTTTCD